VSESLTIRGKERVEGMFREDVHARDMWVEKFTYGQIGTKIYFSL
jgi:hypothetical protein